MSPDALRLLPLDCPSCGATLAAEGEDIIYYCTACRNGYRIRSDESGLERVEVSFVALKDRTAESYRPFWVLDATVDLQEREAAGGGIHKLLGALLGSSGPASGSTYEATFVVPAFRCPLNQATVLIQRYTSSFPELGEKLGERLTGGVFGVEDARVLAEYAFLDAQIQRPDTLRQLRYTLDFQKQRLLGVPFVRQGEGWQDAIYGLPVSAGG